MSSRPSTGGAAAAALFLNDASQTGASDLVARALQRQKNREERQKKSREKPKVVLRNHVSRPNTAEADNESTASSSAQDGDAADSEEEGVEKPKKLTKEEKEMEALEASFQQQMLEMELNEKWQASVEKIPEEVRDEYTPLLQKFSAFLKIKMYKFLDQLDWSLDNSRALQQLLMQALSAGVENTRIDWWFDKMAKWTEHGHFDFAWYHFMTELHESNRMEVFLTLSDDYLDRCFELARFLDKTQLALMYQFCSELSIREVMDAFENSNDPFIKACRLCRTRRLYALENRLVHDQVPQPMIRVTGALPIYDKAELWAAADDKGFTFDAEKGQIYWMEKNTVDLLRICDDCLSDAHGAATSDGRFDDLWNIPATERKAALTALRGREQQMALLITKIAKERIARRTNEWATRARKSQRLGARAEKEAEEERQLQLATEQRDRDKKDAKTQMLRDAGDVDKKWRDEAAQRDAKDLSTHMHTATLNYHLDYTRENPAPATREHPHSWKSAHYLPDGTPMSPVGAVERFGTHTILPDEQTMQLQEWKQRAVESNEDFEARIAAHKERKRAVELESFAEHVEYVDKRIRRLKRNEQKLERTLALEEQARVDKRAADRAARAAIRFAKMEAQERWMMEIQDHHSNRHRFFEWECIQISREREEMWFQECEQCSTDRFWGFEVEAARLKAINDKYKAFYADRVAKTRAQLIFTKQLRPFKIEADLKTFKNPFTGEVLK